MILSKIRDIWLAGQSSAVPLQCWGNQLHSIGPEYLVNFSVKPEIQRNILPCTHKVHQFLSYMSWRKYGISFHEAGIILYCFGKVGQSVSVCPAFPFCIAHDEQSKARAVSCLVASLVTRKANSNGVFQCLASLK